MLPYLRRWAVQGGKPDGDNATTIFDLRHDRRHVVVYPATVDTYAVTVTASAIRMLATTAISGTACAVPADHAVHGRRLLGLRPYQSAHEPSWLNRPADAPPYPGPMELYVVLPGDEIHIVYRHDRLHLLTSVLTEIVDTII
ncbi:hypothetical protein [Actinophytocola glycyrrhizae]|uniref:Uncharacterized protein n=1 Tax=Actinophytocola glycyrrhizae TaxID=2044873 RepID=A0ABV9S4V9_9PSEU